MVRGKPPWRFTQYLFAGREVCLEPCGYSCAAFPTCGTRAHCCWVHTTPATPHRLNSTTQHKPLHSESKRSEATTVERVSMLISEPSRAAQFLSLVCFTSSGHRAPRRAVERRDCTVRVASCTACRLLSGVVILAHQRQSPPRPLRFLTLSFSLNSV